MKTCVNVRRKTSHSDSNMFSKLRTGTTLRLSVFLLSKFLLSHLRPFVTNIFQLFYKFCLFLATSAVTTRMLASVCQAIPWVPETFHTLFPVSVTSLPLSWVRPSAEKVFPPRRAKKRPLADPGQGHQVKRTTFSLNL